MRRLVITNLIQLIFKFRQILSHTHGNILIFNRDFRNLKKPPLTAQHLMRLNGFRYALITGLPRQIRTEQNISLAWFFLPIRRNNLFLLRNNITGAPVNGLGIGNITPRNLLPLIPDPHRAHKGIKRILQTIRLLLQHCLLFQHQITRRFQCGNILKP